MIWDIHINIIPSMNQKNMLLIHGVIFVALNDFWVERPPMAV